MRKGHIKVSDTFYRNNWDEFHIIMKDFRPIRIEYKHWENIWLIYGECDFFEKLNEGDIFPEYKVIFEVNGDGTMEYIFKKV